MDDLPMWALVGDFGEGHNDNEKDGDDVYIWTHKRFDLGYNENQIVDVNVTTAKRVKLVPGITLHFTYQVWFGCLLLFFLLFFFSSLFSLVSSLPSSFPPSFLFRPPPFFSLFLSFFLSIFCATHLESAKSVAELPFPSQRVMHCGAWDWTPSSFLTLIHLTVHSARPPSLAFANAKAREFTGW